MLRRLKQAKVWGGPNMQTQAILETIHLLVDINPKFNDKVHFRKIGIFDIILYNGRKNHVSHVHPGKPLLSAPATRPKALSLGDSIIGQYIWRQTELVGIYFQPFTYSYSCSGTTSVIKSVRWPREVSNKRLSDVGMVGLWPNVFQVLSTRRQRIWHR